MQPHAVSLLAPSRNGLTCRLESRDDVENDQAVRRNATPDPCARPGRGCWQQGVLGGVNYLGRPCCRSRPTVVDILKFDDGNVARNLAWRPALPDPILTLTRQDRRAAKLSFARLRGAGASSTPR